MAEIVNPDTELESDNAHYLVVSSRHYTLSPWLLTAMDRVHCQDANTVTTLDVYRADLILIVDDGLSEPEINKLFKMLSSAKNKLVLAICDAQDNQSRWFNRVDSVFVTKDNREQNNLINRLIESIELDGLVCVDFTDIYSTFCHMQQSCFYQGVGMGHSRAVDAIDQALETRTLVCKTALVIMYTGMDFTLDEYEAMCRHFETKVPNDTCCVFAQKILMEPVNVNQFEVVIFANN